MRFLPTLHDLYFIMCFLYIILTLYLLLRAVHHSKKIDFSFSLVLFLAVLLFIIKVKAPSFLDARPTATLAAICGEDVKHSYSLMFFWKILSWVKSPHFHDIVIYNIFLGSLALVLCYFYFASITKSKRFGILSSIFLGVSSFFYQATISSEYFLVQLIFSFSFFLALFRLRENMSHTNILLFFLSYFLLALSKHEAFSIIGIFPFLLFILKREIKFSFLFIFYSCISFLVIGFITLSLFSDEQLIYYTLFHSTPMREFIAGNYANGYLQHLLHNLATIIKYFPSESIALFLLSALFFTHKRVKAFDLSVVFVIYIPIFIVCFFIHEHGFCKQEGGIKFSYQMITPLLYGWCVLMWKFLQLFKKQKKLLYKIGIFSLIVAINIPHCINAYLARNKYADITRQMKINPFREDVNSFTSSHIYLVDSFVYKINFACDMIKKETLRAIIVDFSRGDIYDYIIREKGLDALCFSIKENSEEAIHQLLPLILEKDVLIGLGDSGDDVTQNKFYNKLLEYLKKGEKLSFGTYETIVTLVGISERGAALLKKLF